MFGKCITQPHRLSRAFCARSVVASVLTSLLLPMAAYGQRLGSPPAEPLPLEPLATLNDVTPMAVSEDGERLLILTEDKVLNDYDVSTGHLTRRASLRTFPFTFSRNGAPAEAVVAPTGKLYAAAFPLEDPPVVRLYDLPTGQLQATCPFRDAGGFPWLLFSPRGDRLVIYTNLGYALRPDAGHLDIVTIDGNASLSLDIPTLTPDDGTEVPFCVAAMAFDATCERLAIAWDMDGPRRASRTSAPPVRLDVVDLTTGETHRRAQRIARESIFSLAFSPDGRFIVAGPKAHDPNGEFVWPPPGTPRSLSIRIDEVAGEGTLSRATAVIPEMRQSRNRTNFDAFGRRIGVSVAPGGRRVYVVGDQVVVWHVHDWETRRFERLGAVPILDRIQPDPLLLLSGDGSTLVTSQELTTQIWNVSAIESPPDDAAE